MRKIFNYISTIFIICLLILVASWLYEYSFRGQPVQSALSDNVSGYAWSANIGWISFNGDNYGVDVDANNSKLSGHAWSSSIGWISFNESDTGVPPSNDPCADNSCIAKAIPSGNLGKSDVPIYGWARALNYGDGWDGWVRFDHGQANEVYIDANGEFHGWAWGGDVIGWISFNCADASASYPFTCGSEGGDICQANEYCPGEIWDVISTDCCSVECELKTCAEQGGDICEENETCPGEIIPAGNTDSCCSATCTIEPVIPEPYCGDGNLDLGEQCDDGNNNNGDGCSATCTVEHTLETCLDDCRGDRLSCTAGCRWWQVGCREDCLEEYSICRTYCENLYCGNCVIDSGEQCDDCNASNTDACLNTCINATCGDGYVRSGVEQCDDGNNNNGDGCSATCTVEAAPPKPPRPPREPPRR